MIMDMIFDELKYAEKLISGGFTKFLSADINILAKYFRSLGRNESEIQSEIFKLCEDHISGFNQIMYEERINKIIRSSTKSSLRRPKPVPITKSEIEKIRELKNYRYEKIIFTLLVLAKYYKITSTSDKVSSDKYFINLNFNSIFRLAHTSQKKDENIAHILYTGGYIIDTNKKDTYMIVFTDVTDESDPVIVVDDMEDIIKFYQPYCSVCGTTISKNSNRQQMCDECWKEKRAIQNRENFNRWYDKHKKND